MGFPTKMIILGCGIGGTTHLRKHPHAGAKEKHRLKNSGTGRTNMFVPSTARIRLYVLRIRDFPYKSYSGDGM